jgi:hypothetical protein
MGGEQRSQRDQRPKTAKGEQKIATTKNTEITGSIMARELEAELDSEIHENH